MEQVKAKKHILRRILLGLAAAFLCFVVFLCVRFVYSMLTPIDYGSADYREDSSIRSADWMSGLEDQRKLSEITLPGTHDSTTEYIVFPYSYSCQDTSVCEQLEAGYRFLDLRCLSSGDEILMHHANGICKEQSGFGAESLTLHDICEETYAFLSAHPTECVIWLLTSDDNEFLADYLAKEIQGHEEYWFTDNVNPSLGDVRGRIVTMTRDSSGATDYGIGVIYAAQAEDGPYVSGTTSCGSRLLYQDLYELGVEDKWEAFTALLSDCPADADTYSINYLSCASGLCNIPSPKENARVLNNRLMQEELSAGNYGIVIVDFATEEIARKLFLTNFDNS